jgi:hypothetical protein
MRKANQYVIIVEMELFNQASFVMFHYITMVAALQLVLSIKVTTVTFRLRTSHIVENVVTPS